MYNNQINVPDYKFYVTQSQKGVFFIDKVVIVNYFNFGFGIVFAQTEYGEIINAKFLSTSENIGQDKLEFLSKRLVIKIPEFIQEFQRRSLISRYRKLSGKKPYSVIFITFGAKLTH